MFLLDEAQTILYICRSVNVTVDRLDVVACAARQLV
jgi:hypothetical protein